MRIRITQEDIDRGELHSPTRDPIALALSRDLQLRPGQVEIGDPYTDDSGGWHVPIDLRGRRVEVPSEAMAEFIHRFDNDDREYLEPTEMELPI